MAEVIELKSRKKRSKIDQSLDEEPMHDVPDDGNGLGQVNHTEQLFHEAQQVKKASETLKKLENEAGQIKERARIYFQNRQEVKLQLVGKERRDSELELPIITSRLDDLINQVGDQKEKIYQLIEAGTKRRQEAAKEIRQSVKGQGKEVAKKFVRSYDGSFSIGDEKRDELLLTQVKFINLHRELQQLRTRLKDRETNKI